jgi:hypothetical protein
MSSDDFKVSSVPTWNGKREEFSRYLDQFQAICEANDIGDALDPVMMQGCPTKSEYDALDKTSAAPDVVAKVTLYKANRKAASWFTLGQKQNIGMAAFKSTKSDEHPFGNIAEVFAKLAVTNKPKDFTAKIELEAELNRVPFKKAEDYKASVEDVLARYDVPMDQETLITILAKKVQNTTYTDKILTELESTNPSLEHVCLEISKIQRLARSTGKVDNSEGKEKEVSLNDTESEHKSGNGKGKKPKCSHCGKAHKRADCTDLKAKLKKQGPCPGCDKDGHLESECWKLHPEKKPKWYGKSKSGETSSSNVELMCVQVGEEDFA